MPKERETRPRTGLRAIKAAVKVRGLTAVSRRTAAGKALIEWKTQLVTDLGGMEQLSAQKLALVELCARARLYVDHLDAFLMEQPSLINRRKKSILPILRERTQLADSLARLLGQIGLEKIPKRIPSLAEVLARHEQEKSAAIPEPTSECTDAPTEVQE